jgi:hypothetical protein
MILPGLDKIRPDHRDFDFHLSFGSPTSLPSFPLEYCTDLNLWMPSQNAMALPLGCTGFAGADAAADEDGVLYDPGDLYRRTPPGTDVKLPRFRGVFDGFVDYGSVVTTSIMASYAIGER